MKIRDLPKREQRRYYRERAIKKVERWLTHRGWGYSYIKEPHKYWFLDPKDEEDMLMIWSLDDDDLAPYRGRHTQDQVIYVIGYGIKNPPEEKIDPWDGQPYTPKLPHLTDEDVEKEIREDALRRYTAPQSCSKGCCGNVRSNEWAPKMGTVQEYQARDRMLDELEELGYDRSHFLDTRIRKKLTW